MEIYSLKYGTKLVFLTIFLFLILFTGEIYSQKMTGKFYERLDAPPWAMSILSPDTGDVYFPIKKLDDVSDIKVMAIRDYVRFAEDGKGPNYLEVPGEVNKDGTFEIDVSAFKDGDLVVIATVKKGFIKLWHALRFYRKENYNNMKIILVRIKKANKKSEFK